MWQRVEGMSMPGEARRVRRCFTSSLAILMADNREVASQRTVFSISTWPWTVALSATTWVSNAMTVQEARVQARRVSIGSLLLSTEATR